MLSIVGERQRIHSGPYAHAQLLMVRYNYQFYSYTYMRNHNSLGCEQPLGLDVNQSDLQFCMELSFLLTRQGRN